MADAIEVLKEDHRTVEGLFEKLEGTGNGDSGERQELVREIIRELVIHASIEERELYPVIREELPGGEQLIDEHLKDHSEVEEVLAELQDADPDSAEFAQKVGQLISDVREHVEEEETQTLPQLQEALSADRLQQLGTALREAKDTAPTRPHPKAPSGDVKKLTDPGAAVVDRARDAAREELEEE